MTPKPPQRAGSLWQSFRFAWAGWRQAVRTQRNLRLHLVAAVIVLVLAAWLQLPLTHWALLILLIGLVIAGEIANTVVETVVDLASPEIHPLAKRAKDMAAGLVLWLVVIAVIIGVLILGPPLWEKFAGSSARAAASVRKHGGRLRTEAMRARGVVPPARAGGLPKRFRVRGQATLTARRRSGSRRRGCGCRARC